MMDQEIVDDRLTSYEQILVALLSHEHVFYSPETSPHPELIRQRSNSTRFTTGFRTIASLSLHPAIESALHILNADLVSAHFLLRHAQAPPALECMYLHGVLHRIEGDIDNARRWYKEVRDSALWKEIWLPVANSMQTSGEACQEQWLDRLDQWMHGKTIHKIIDADGNSHESTYWQKEEQELKRSSLRELRKVLDFCERKFGTAEWKDARDVWVSDCGELKQKKNNMLVGGEGWREF